MLYSMLAVDKQNGFVRFYRTLAKHRSTVAATARGKIVIEGDSESDGK